MGAGTSRSIALDNPFPVSATLSRDLDKLSMVAARILSTPDIYDINNLARPGVCGDYAVFLKKDIEKQLLPFVADISGVALPVAYQNPRRLIDKPEMRKEICSQLADTMLTAIATVVASLASIQVAWQPSREAAVAAVAIQRPSQIGGGSTHAIQRPSQMGGGSTHAIQRGGAISEVTDWLATNGYIQPIPGGSEIIGRPIELINRRVVGTAGSRPTFQLVFGATQDGMHPAALSASGGSPAMPAGSLKINFIKPIQITLPGTTKSILPFRISDNSGLTWMIGVLYEDVFQTLAISNTKGPFDPFQIWEFLFRRTQGYTGELHDTRSQLNEANEVFNQYRRTKNPQVILSALSRFLSGRIPGYVPSGAVPAPQPPYGYPTWAPPPAGAGAGAAYAPAPFQPLAYSYAPGTRAAPGVAGAPGVSVALRPAEPSTAGIQYDIPLDATKIITDMFKTFRDLLAKQSSPAATRAVTLSTKVNEGPPRSIQTNICRDPYWTLSNLNLVYPWATLQFLSFTDLKKLTRESRVSESILMPEWRQFIDELEKLYATIGVSLTRATPRSYFLDQIRVTGIDKIKVCEEGRAGAVAFQPIQEALAEIQELYTAHVAAMWKILNSLIVVIADPAKKTEMVRLHPDVFSGTVKSSKAYVDEKAAVARKLIIDFYLRIETIYVNTIKRL